ncbi:MAG: D-alanyl-D-alanine carboxypeptidase, partial [Actinomycetota bacterium]|nr:D-alanyl-D-alanine carboxypeptidase [Actinomycetota bacterium]
ALHGLVTALPVAGWSGTLAGRYVGSSAGPGSALSLASAAGDVRAKTGTLTAVSTLAGIVYDQDGRALVFALLADRVAPGSAATASAESALDGVAAALATCGCH